MAEGKRRKINGKIEDKEDGPGQGHMDKPVKRAGKKENSGQITEKDGLF